ncbi:MAG: hypothetical protein LQ346_008205, partial [Caloplaca aetnensis]
MDPYHGHPFADTSQHPAEQQKMMEQQTLDAPTPPPDIKTEASMGKQADHGNLNEPGYGPAYLEHYHRATGAAPTSYYGRPAGGPIQYQNPYEKIMQQCQRAQGQKVLNDGGFGPSYHGPIYSTPDQVHRTTGTAIGSHYHDPAYGAPEQVHRSTATTMNEHFAPSYGLPFRQVNYNAHPSFNLD